jgi:hypothetical protein
MERVDEDREHIVRGAIGVDFVAAFAGERGDGYLSGA